MQRMQQGALDFTQSSRTLHYSTTQAPLLPDYKLATERCEMSHLLEIPVNIYQAYRNSMSPLPFSFPHLYHEVHHLQKLTPTTSHPIPSHPTPSHPIPSHPTQRCSVIVTGCTSWQPTSLFPGSSPACCCTRQKAGEGSQEQGSGNLPYPLHTCTHTHTVTTHACV